MMRAPRHGQEEVELAPDEARLAMWRASSMASLDLPTPVVPQMVMMGFRGGAMVRYGIEDQRGRWRGERAVFRNASLLEFCHHRLELRMVSTRQLVLFFLPCT